jgi:hypothetical protein
MIADNKMSDPASTARSARESLSRGLNALQSDPNLPPKLMDLAAPIAQAMGALHQIERSNGAQLLPHANVALENVRAALSALQTEGQQFPAVATAMESVAGSLGLVHALSKLAGGAPQQAPQAQPVPQAPQPQIQAPPQQQPPRTQPVAQQPQQAFPQPARPQPAQFQPQPVPQQAPVYAPPPQGQYAAAADPFAAPRAQQPAQSPMAATSYGGPPPQASPQQMQSAGAPPPVVGGEPFAADLGAQSSTNFYKGLSGNDIIDHGGLFISTYKIPKIGTPVRLRVSLPGGYEFEANAVVRWSREASEASEDESAPPGFGAQFTHITNEARQLVYRYVRNREPLFHDDL